MMMMMTTMTATHTTPNSFRLFAKNFYFSGTNMCAHTHRHACSHAHTHRQWKSIHTNKLNYLFVFMPHCLYMYKYMMLVYNRQRSCFVRAFTHSLTRSLAHWFVRFTTIYWFARTFICGGKVDKICHSCRSIQKHFSQLFNFFNQIVCACVCVRVCKWQPSAFIALSACGMDFLCVCIKIDFTRICIFISHTSLSIYVYIIFHFGAWSNYMRTLEHFEEKMRFLLLSSSLACVIFY